jgi:transposase
MTRRNQHYPPELRERAVRMVAEVTPNYDSQWAAIGAVAQKLGVGTAETVRKWVRQATGMPSRLSASHTFPAP